MARVLSVPGDLIPPQDVTFCPAWRNATVETQEMEELGISTFSSLTHDLPHKAPMHPFSSHSQLHSVLQLFLSSHRLTDLSKVPTLPSPSISWVSTASAWSHGGLRGLWVYILLRTPFSISGAGHWEGPIFIPRLAPHLCIRPHVDCG